MPDEFFLDGSEISQCQPKKNKVKNEKINLPPRFCFDKQFYLFRKQFYKKNTLSLQNTNPRGNIRLRRSIIGTSSAHR